MRKKITFILSITIGILGGFIGSYVCLLKEIKKRIQLRELSDKHLDLVQLLDKWLMEKQHKLCSNLRNELYRKEAI